jgi:hypothetical protein
MNKDQDALRSPHDLYRLLHDPSKVYSFERLVSRLDVLFREWVVIVFCEPELSDTYLERSKNKKEAQARERLQKAREHLSQQGGPDPIDEAVAIAARARRSTRQRSAAKAAARKDDNSDGDDEDEENHDPAPQRQSGKRKRHSKGGFYRKSERATAIEFEDYDDVEDSDDDAAVLPDPKRPLKVSSPGTPGKARKSQQKPYEGRRPWTDLEKKAIIEGIPRHGFGKWAKIKEEYDSILKHRTSGQIKVNIYFVFEQCCGLILVLVLIFCCIFLLLKIGLRPKHEEERRVR